MSINEIDRPMSLDKTERPTSNGQLLLGLKRSRLQETKGEGQLFLFKAKEKKMDK